MWLLTRIIVLILINYSCSSTIPDELPTVESINGKTTSKILKMQKSIDNHDVIPLNVGGEIIMTTRETLTRVPKSTLAIMFNGRWEHRLPTDQNGNFIFDFNPILFRHLLGQLQILHKNESIEFYPPAKLTLVEPFKKMLQKLGLYQFFSTEKNIISFNVGGQIIRNRRTTFTHVFNTTFNTNVSSATTAKLDRNSDIFLDNDPKLFHHLIHQLRETPFKNTSYFKTPSSKTSNAFKRMLMDLNINRQMHSVLNIDKNTKWLQNGLTIAGGHGKGNGSNQLNWPEGIYIDDDEHRIYIADSDNHRVVEWKFDSNSSHTVAGGNGQGNRIDQLDYPTDVIVDKKNDSLIICDCRNRRIVRWFRRNITHGQTIMFDIDCYGLAMDRNGDLYISDLEKNEVKRWKIGDDDKGVIVAGGNGEGNQLNQLSLPTSIFVDQDQSIYISDEKNHRIMKWKKDAKEGLIVAGGQDQGNNLTQLSYPQGVIVDHVGNIYIADSRNNRILRWIKDSEVGHIVAGGRGQGKQANQLHYPKDLSFDRQGNLYVVDWDNNRVQKFEVDLY